MLVDADPFESLATPVAWLDAAGALRECNPAFAHWLGVGRRRLLGLPATTLSADAQLGTGLARVQAQGAAIRLRRARFAFPGGEERFADVWLVPDAQDGTLRLEDEKGHIFVVASRNLAFVEIGQEKSRKVGFAP